MKGTPLIEAFPADYFSARERFIERAKTANWELSSHEIAARGPNGEPLSIDTAVFEPRDAAGTVIVSSALHGVEGFLGSAVQCALLSSFVDPKWARGSPRIVFVHALNPYGYAWLRRCNEDNVDLNRNFVIDPQDYRGSPEGYDQLDPFLNPPTPPSRWEFFRWSAFWTIQRYGMAALKQAIVTGQYDFPRGLFFGGHSACESTRYVKQQFSDWIDSSGRVIHLDIHTGVGPSGRLQLLCDEPLSPEEARQTERDLGHPPVRSDAAEGVQYVARGSIGEWCTRAAHGRAYRYLCAEFGTHSAVTVLSALRAENRAHHWGDNPQRYQWTKARLREAFCPASAAWRNQTLATGVNLVRRAIDALVATPK